MKVHRFSLATQPPFRTQLPAELAAMAAAAHAGVPAAERGVLRRPGLSLTLSLALHAFVLSLSFGGQGLGLPGLGLPWTEQRMAPPRLQVRLTPPPTPASGAGPAPAADARPAFTALPAEEPHHDARPEPAMASPAPPAPDRPRAMPAVPPPAPAPTELARSPGPSHTESAAIDRQWLALESQPETWSVPAAASEPARPLRETIAPDPAETSRETQALQSRLATLQGPPPIETAHPDKPEPVQAQKSPPRASTQVQAQEQERLARQALALQEALRREAARLEARAQAQAQEEQKEQEERSAAEAARQEADRQAARVEAQRLALARAEAQRAEAARQEAARVEAARAASEAQAARDEAARQDALRAEAARQEAARAATQRAEAASQEAARAEAARQETARAEAARQEAQRAEAARAEALRQEAARLDGERQAGAQAAAQAAAAARVAQLEAAERREARLREIGRQLDEERAQRDAAAASARQSQQLPYASSQRRGRLMGRSDPNPELVAYGEAWARKIQLDTTRFDKLRDLLRQPHFDALVTVAVRADGSVESVSFVRSSGSVALDAAIERVVRELAHYPPFPPVLARDYDVIEIRRTWHFDTGIRLY